MESTNEKHWYRKRENAKLQWCNTILTAEYWVDLRENTGCNQESYINYDQLWQSWERDEITWQFPAFFPHSKWCIGYNYQAELKPTSQGTGAATPRKAWRPTSSMRWWMRFWSRCWSAWRIAGEPHGDCTNHSPRSGMPNKWDELQKTMACLTYAWCQLWVTSPHIFFPLIIRTWSSLPSLIHHLNVKLSGNDPNFPEVHLSRLCQTVQVLCCHVCFPCFPYFQIFPESQDLAIPNIDFITFMFFFQVFPKFALVFGIFPRFQGWIPARFSAASTFPQRFRRTAARSAASAPWRSCGAWWRTPRISARRCALARAGRGAVGMHHEMWL